MRRVRRRRWCGGRSASRERPRGRASGSARSSTVAWPWSYLLWRGEVRIRTGRTAGGRGAAPAGSATGACLRAIPTFGAHGTLVVRISRGAEGGMRRLSYWGVHPSTWPHLLLRRPRAGGFAANDSSAGSYRARRTAADRGPTWPSAPGSQRVAGAGYRAAMDLAYPQEAEDFRVEIAGWLKENLPAGWGEPGFSMTPEERKAFNEQWTATLFAGGWICASWPTEYGGKGLSLLQQVVLNEEFARAGRAAAGRLLRRHPRRPHHPAVGHRGAEAAVHPRHPEGRDLVVPGVQRARRRLGPGRPQDQGRARR